MSFLLSLHQWNDYGLLALRVAIGVIFWVHGRQKAGMWKMLPSEQMSAGLLGKMKFLSIVEPLGALGVLFGLLTQPTAAGLALVMLSAIYYKAAVWKLLFTEQGKNGWEFDLMILAGTLMLMFAGAGIFSLDHLWLGL